MLVSSILALKEAVEVVTDTVTDVVEVVADTVIEVAESVMGDSESEDSDLEWVILNCFVVLCLHHHHQFSML